MLVVEGEAVNKDGAKDLKDYNKDLTSLNALVRNKVIMPSKVLDHMLYTQKALFKLLKFIEYLTNCEIYDMAW